jgi:DNA-binding MarR family transcriptional regulator
MDATEPALPLDELIGYQLRRLSATTMAALAERLGQIGLRPTDATVLTMIATQGGLTQSAIGRELGIQRANMAPLVAALERRGLIAREPTDGRSHGLSLTTEGVRIAAEAQAIIAAHEARIAGALPNGQKAQFLALLQRVREQF